MEEEKKEAEFDEAGAQRGSFEAFRGIVAALRSKDGCPWDREQTLESLKPFLLDEAAEVLAGIDLFEEEGDAANLCEELGDLLLELVLMAQIAQEEGLFSMEDVIRGISRKMIRRHPHVFGEAAALRCMPPGTDPAVFHPDRGRRTDTEEAWTLWRAVKRAEKQTLTPEEAERQKQRVKEAADWAAAYLSGRGESPDRSGNA